MMLLVFVFDFPIRELLVVVQSNYTVEVMTKFFNFNIPAKFLTACFLAPLWEESVFRYAPIRFAQFCDTLVGKPWMLLPIVFMSSIIFGILHGSVINIIFQGVGGLMLCWIYLKNGNSYWSVVIAHAVWNFLIIFLNIL